VTPIEAFVQEEKDGSPDMTRDWLIASSLQS